MWFYSPNDRNQQYKKITHDIYSRNVIKELKKIRLLIEIMRKNGFRVLINTDSTNPATVARNNDK
ncbi:hypothetical protein Hanom_Chr10g00873151 [Helianthus anomalus]